MARYATTVSSPLSVEEAFDYLASFEHVAQWDPGVVEAQALDGEVQAGSRFRVVVRSLGRELPLEYRITEYVRPRRVVLVAEAATFRSLDTITVDPAAGGGCRVTYVADLSLRGPLRVAEPLLRMALRRIGDRAADGLRRALGARAPAEG